MHFAGIPVTMAVGTLLERVRANREEHIKQFKEAELAWRRRAVRHLEGFIASLREEDTPLIELRPPFGDVFRAIAAVHTGRRFDLVDGAALKGLLKDLPAIPVSYQRAYDDAIAMLEATTAAEVELSELNFSQLILNRWDWTEQWQETYRAVTG